MPWGAIAATAVYALVGRKLDVLDPTDMPAPYMPPAAQDHKCEGCGSRNFARLNGKEICAYCRSDR